MEMLDSNQPNQIRILYYISPNRFYVYLRDKLNSHNSVREILFVLAKVVFILFISFKWIYKKLRKIFDLYHHR